MQLRLKYLFLLFIGISVWATPKTCLPLLNSIAPIAPWSFEERNLELKAEDLLPKEFLEEVAKAKGPLTPQVRFRDGRIDITLSIGPKNWMTFALIEDQKRPEAVIIDNLVLENPLAEKPREKLNQEQNNKGLPLPIFRYARDRFFEIARAGGYKIAHTNSQQHYSVIMLYRKIVGMEPATAEATQILDKLDAYYKFSRRNLPEDVRANSLEEFSTMLGGYNTFPTGLTSERVKILEEYFKTGTLPSGIQIHKDIQGNPIAAVFPKEDGIEGRVVFIDSNQGKARILTWYKINYSHLLDLQKKL